MALQQGRVAVVATKKISDKLNVLLGAALALPGITVGQDKTQPKNVQIDFNHSNYKESDRRMDIDVTQLAVTAPLADNYSVTVNLIKDITSGASPVLYLADAGEEPVMVLQAGASIKDTRDVYDVAGSYYGDKFTLTGKIGKSTEDDYEARFASIDYRYYLNNNNTILSGSYAQSNDKTWNVYFSADSSKFDPFLDPIDKNKRKQQDVKFSIDQVLDKNSRLQFALTYVRSSGKLDDPYKKIYVQDIGDISNTTEIFDNLGSAEALEELIIGFSASITPQIRQTFGIFDDKRPDGREQFIPLLRYSRYFSVPDAAIHLDYRFSADDWGADSHTIEIQWKQQLLAGVIITPAVRYYSQDNVDFYHVVFSSRPDDGIHSSDYRLAGFGARSYKLSLEKTFVEKYFVQLYYESYQRDYDLAWKSSSRGSDVDDYDVDFISVSFGYRYQ